MFPKVAITMQAIVLVWVSGWLGLTNTLIGQSQSAKQTTMTAEETLARAKHDLQISQATFERIKDDLIRLLEQDDVEELDVYRDYAIYFDRVRSMVHGQQRLIDAMEGVQAPSTTPASETPWKQIDSELYEPSVEPDVTDPLEELDRQFDQELSDFDAYLLEQQFEARKKLEQLDEASSEEMTELAREAAAAVERLRQKGIDVNTDSGAEGEGQGQSGSSGGQGGSPGSPSGGQSGSEGQEGSSDAGGQEGQSGEQGSGEPSAGGEGQAGGGSGASGSGEGAGGESGSGGSGDASGEGSGAGGTNDPDASGSGGPGSSDDDQGQGGTPKGDRPPADDDDIVARQLREAAEKETDPVLREKLWEEYDRYKGNA